jgi:hypothetical protein
LSVLLYKAWPVLLALFVILIGFQIWQQYHWKQWSQQVNPFFNELIKENQGCLTTVDLSMKANLAGSAAKRYLDKKAEEFGAQRLVYEDKGTVYYFLTASALGSIFDDSEPSLELDSESFSSQAPKFPESLTQKELLPSVDESSTSDLPEPLEAPEKVSYSEFSAVEKEAPLEPSPQPKPEETESLDEKDEKLEPLSQPKPEETESLDEKQDVWADSPEKEQRTHQSLIQAELAKRLDVHSSTVGKRKSDEDFAEWSQSRDPEGIAWVYSPETKEFVPIE